MEVQRHAAIVALQLTSRQLYLRARRVIYATNRFFFSDYHQLDNFVSAGYPSHSMVTSMKVEIHLNHRVEDTYWKAAFDKVLLLCGDLRSLSVHIHIEHGNFQKEDWIAPPENNELVSFASIPSRPSSLKDVDLRVMTSGMDWLDFVGISLTHLSVKERINALRKQADWVEKVRARLLGTEPPA